MTLDRLRIWGRARWLSSTPSSSERKIGRLASRLASHPILWRERSVNVGGRRLKTTKISERYLATLKSDVDDCEALAVRAREGALADNEPALARDAFPLILGEHVRRRAEATSDYFGALAVSRAGLARCYESGWTPGVLHLSLAKQCADGRHPATARAHLALARLIFEDLGDDELLDDVRQVEERMEEVASELQPRLEEVQSLFTGKYRKSISTSIQVSLIIGHLPLAFEMAQKAVGDGLLTDALEPCLVGALLYRAQGDLDRALDWLRIAQDSGVDDSVIETAAAALTSGVVTFVDTVETLGVSWMSAGIPSGVLIRAQEALEVGDPQEARLLLQDPSVYYLPTTFPQLLKLVAFDTADALVRRALFEHACGVWQDLNDDVQEALGRVQLAEIERSAGRPMTSAASAVQGLLQLEKARRRNRLGSTRRVVLDEMVDHVHLAILDLERRSSEPEWVGASSPPPNRDYAKLLDAMRHDALALLVRQGNETGPRLAVKLRRLAEIELAGVPSPGAEAPVRSTADVVEHEEIIAELEAALGNTGFLDVVFPAKVAVPPSIDCHQIIIDSARRPDGQLGIFGVWLRPGDRGSSIFWDSLGARATKLLEAMRSPVETNITVPRVLTDAAETDLALAELADALPEELRSDLVSGRSSELVIVPTGPLWGVPWTALPIDDEPLVRHATIRLAPSTALISQRHVAGLVPDIPVVTGAIAPELSDLGGAAVARELRDMVQDARSLAGLGHAEHRDVTLVVSHGSPLPGLAHQLAYDEERYTAADLITGPNVGGLVILLACWSAACTYERGTEPVALPTAALVRGARSVIASQWALPAEAVTRIAVDLLRHPFLLHDAPAALRDVQLAARERNPDPSTWATLACYG